MRRMLAAVLLLGSCESDIPPAEEGLRVTGVVSYGGTAHMAFARPGVVINLFTEFPPMSPPRGSLTIEGATFTTPMPYEVVGVPAGSYKIVVQVVDLATATTMGMPTGSFPSFCALLAPVANIVVQDDDPTTDVNVVIYDPGRDPCLGGPRPVDAGASDAAVVDAPLVMPPDAATFDAPVTSTPDARSFDARTLDAATFDAPP